MDQTNHPSQDKYDDDGEQQQGVQMSQVRSYECTFCKRGFSNAQALGGHMNIHRKDKAKLKQSSSNPTPDHHLPPKNWPWIFSDPESIDHATPTMFKHDQSTTSTTHFGQHQEFPTRYENQESRGKGFFSSSSQEKVVMGEDNLDLELRLGHEPSQDHSPGATGMMKFL